MRADILLTALAGASSASAMVMRIAAESMEYDWAVTGWSAGCARQGCYYDFNITGEANLTSRPATPAFKAYCAGDGEGSPYRLCQRIDEEDTDAIVVAKLLPSNTTTNGTRHAKIQVSLRYTDLYSSTTWWNFTGRAVSFYNQFSAPLQNFTITPTEITGVA
ncbi:hypothetical protein F5B22DRAFT_44506 [Xylaria bambusicola]|uniref:uncharacterized protein n=1 Tax=Xylaria bambusicola TaxID=326684 RepID=UPI002008B15F|nr:uncharacterized protein F5B22DRAFT_44506 [Xylaria bambusicola]KAI0502840.1 hypothetical protein F5B22DRAFT_44506 [Xylaria bambusicola]